MNIDRTATKQEIDLCILSIEKQLKEDDMKKLWRDAEFCRRSVEAYRCNRGKTGPVKAQNVMSGRWLLLGFALSSTVVISALYLLVRFV